MQEYNDPTALIVQALMKPQGIQVAGDVIPFPSQPSYLGVGTGVGPTNKSADYGWELKSDPKVDSIGKETMTNWLSRAGNRYRGTPVIIPPATKPSEYGSWPTLPDWM